RRYYDRYNSGARKRVDEVWPGLPDGERADNRAYREPAACTKPGRDHFHGRRIDAGQGKARQQSTREQALIAWCEKKRRIRKGTDDCRNREQASRGDNVREIEQRRDSSAKDETELHDCCNPADSRGGQLPSCPELRRDG